MSEMQLEIAMGKRKNYFREAVGAGKFVFLAEAPLPEEERNLHSAAERIMPLAEKMWSLEDLSGGITIPDIPGTPWSAAEFSSVLPEEQRNRNLFLISGSGRTEEDYRRELTLAAASGIENLVAVTGDAAPYTLRECRKRPFFGSLEGLKKMEEANSFFPGGCCNPFHYLPETVMAQYSLLEKKFSAGARFLIVQSGWDMLQLQSVAWFLRKRNLYYPLIARLTFLSPDKVEKIAAGEIPGMRFSREFLKVLQRELCGNKAQFEAAQYRRIEIQAAGCRLMGFSGVQICGVDFPGRGAILAERFRSALREFQSFDAWLDEYNAHQAGAEMNFNAKSFHLYDRVLRRDYPQDFPPNENEPEKKLISRTEKAGHAVRKFFFSAADSRPAGRDRLLKQLLVRCRGCAQCNLAAHEFVCVQNCPKHLSEGPCGGVRTDGNCEIGNFPCPHIRAARLSYWQKTRKHLESDSSGDIL